MIEQWHIDNAKSVLQDSRNRMAEMAKENGIDANLFTTETTDMASYCLGCVRALDLGISVIDSMNQLTAPEQRTLRQDVMSLTKDIRNGFASTLEDIAWRIKMFDVED